jgi:ABC-type branched-subunit amino acid transport system ATPase component
VATAAGWVTRSPATPRSPRNRVLLQEGPQLGEHRIRAGPAGPPARWRRWRRKVLLDGIDIAGLPSYQIARRGVGPTFPVSNEFPKLTVLENMLAAVQGVRGDSLRSALLSKRYWRSAEENNVRRAAELMDRFGMSAMANEWAATLSGGQRRLLEIMRALMARPRLLLLDKPMAGLTYH